LAQSERIAQLLNKDLGTVTITHPYHPLYGQSFPVLKTRRYPSGRRFSLLVKDDVISVPESWIRPPAPEGDPCCYFSADSLKALLGFIENLNN